jgi:hypothetical protein
VVDFVFISFLYLLMLFELDTGVLQEVNTVFCVHVFCKIELEVELPSGYALGQLPFVVQECKTKLDDLQKIHVAAK